MHAAVFAFANITTQLKGGEPLPMRCSVPQQKHIHSASRTLQQATPGGGGIVAMADYATESIFDLLTEESLDSRSISSIGSHHLSLESHMGKMNKTPAPPPSILSEPSKYITQCSGKFWGAGI